MKALLVRNFAPASDHRVETVADPVPGADEVLIQVAAAGVNYPDTLVVSGKYQILPALPFVPGKDASGTVLRTGPGVTGFKPGDRVVAHMEHGAYASQAVARAAHCHLLPDGVSHEDAAAMGLVFQTAYLALLERGGFRAGETVLVNGAAGGVGGAAVQLVKALGGIALAGVNTPQQAQAAREMGADHVIDLSAENLRDSLRDQVWAATAGRGADIVLDPLGDEVFAASLRALAWCGRLVVIGFAAGQIPTLKANYLLLKNISVIGLQWSDYRDRQPEKIARAQARLLRMREQGLIRPRLAASLPLEDVAIALQALEQGRATGKYVVHMEYPGHRPT